MRDAITNAAVPSTGEASVKRRRELAAEMRAKGYKRVVRWVPDLENPTFTEQRKKDLQALAQHQRTHTEELIDLTEDDLNGWV